MSLVNEALKKARLEAARQEARRRGDPLPDPPPAETRRDRRPAIVAGAIVVGLAGAVLLFWAGRRSATPVPTADPDPTVVDTSPAAPAEPAPPAGATTAPAASAPLPRPADEGPAAGAAPETIAADPAPPQARPAPAETRRTSDAPPRPAAAAAAEPAPGVPPGEPRERVGEAPTGSGVLELGGIAFSEDRPFALINGQVVAPGDTILGYTVVRIEPRSVELSSDRGAVVLTLR